MHQFRLLCLMLLLSLSAALSAQTDAEKVVLLGRSALYFDDYITAIRYFNQAIEARPYFSKAYYYRAYAKFTLEDYHGAETDCSQAINLNPFVTEVYKLRGLCRIHNNDLKGATEDYSRVLTEEPTDQNSLYNRALCFLELKNYEKADSDMNSILMRQPKFGRARLVKAQIALEEKDTTKAMLQIDTLLKDNPKDAAGWAFKGRHALEKENYPLADSCLTQAIELRYDEADYYVSRALARHGMNLFSGALSDYDRVIELIPQHFVAHYNRGLLRAQVGDDNRAIEDFDFIIKEEPDNTLAIYNRALLREQTGDFNGAIKDYTTLLKTYPNFIYGYMARGRCRRKVGDIRGAERDETKVLRADLDLMYGNGKKQPVKKVRKRSDKSLENYNQLVEEDADTTHILFNDLFGKVQNMKSSREFLPMFSLSFLSFPTKGYHSVAFLPEVERINQTGLTKQRLICTAETTSKQGDDLASILHKVEQDITDKQNAEAHVLRSVVLAHQYNYTDALREMETALSSDSLSWLNHLQYAVLLTRIKSTEELLGNNNSTKSPPHSYAKALHELNKALQLSPNTPYIYYNRGCVHALQKNHSAALEDFNKAIELDPSFAEAHYNRAILYMLIGENDKAIPDLSRAGEIGLYKAYNLLKQVSKQNSRK